MCREKLSMILVIFGGIFTGLGIVLIFISTYSIFDLLYKQYPEIYCLILMHLMGILSCLIGRVIYKEFIK
jgi:hypothetical protein